MWWRQQGLVGSASTTFSPGPLTGWHLPACKGRNPTAPLRILSNCCPKSVGAPSLEVPKATDGALGRLVGGEHPAHGRGVGAQWSLRSLPTQPFYESMILVGPFQFRIFYGEKQQDMGVSIKHLSSNRCLPVCMLLILSPKENEMLKKTSSVQLKFPPLLFSLSFGLALFSLHIQVLCLSSRTQLRSSHMII